MSLIHYSKFKLTEAFYCIVKVLKVIILYYFKIIIISFNSAIIL